jgi:hypothetical protein
MLPAAHAATWVKYASDDVSIQYFDSQSFNTSGPLRGATIMLDLKQPMTLGGIAGIRSVAARYEYDCSNNTYRSATEMSYRSAMANGDIVGIEKKDGPMVPINPKSTTQSIADAVCRKAK